MKTSYFLSLAVATLAIEFSLASAQAAPGTNTTVVTNSVQKSVFTVPANKEEGRDPFYPTSSRLWAITMVAAPTVKAKPTGLDCLTLKGLSGTAADPLAMINGRTMSRGEDAEINTDCGRILVHCVDITSTNAVIEVSGERKELRLRSDF
jgi:hypothetical protein